MEEEVKYYPTYQGWCGVLPCTKNRTEIRIDSKIKDVYKEVEINECCPGYTETPNRKCAPICLRACQNGRCVRPNVCQCHQEPTQISPGFVGLTCSRFVCLAADKWGSKCDRQCDCPQNSYCSASTGKCLCRDGWRGTNCTEECETSMNCEGLELPPIIEPETNIIDDTLMAPSARLEALTLERELETENTLATRSVTSLVAAHMGINLFLTILTFTLIFTVFWYKRRLNQMRNDLYYGQYSANAPSSNGSSSNYYPANPSSIYSDSSRKSMSNRPRMPLPDESGYLAKNVDLTFAAATRNILRLDGEKFEPLDKNKQLLINSKVEERLLSSRRDSEKNIYADVKSSPSDKSFKIVEYPQQSSLNIIPETTILAIDTSSSSDENGYQVPRSPASRSTTPILRQVALDEQCTFPNGDNSNLYEEIQPSSPHKQSDREQ